MMDSEQQGRREEVWSEDMVNTKAVQSREGKDIDSKINSLFQDAGSAFPTRLRCQQ